MRLLFVVHQYPPDRIGGTEVYTQGVARGLQARGHQTAVYYRAGGTPQLDRTKREDVRVYRASGGAMTSWGVFRSTFGNRHLDRSFSKVLEEFRPDWIHFQHLMGFPTSLVDQATSKGIPFGFTFHDYWFICANAQLLTNYDQQLCEGPESGGLNCARCALSRAGTKILQPVSPVLVPLFALRRKLLERALEKAAWLIAPSKFLMQRMQQWGAPRDRFVHLPNGIDTEEATQSASAPSDRPLRVVYIGGLAHQKGVHILIEAFNREELDATLEVYGDPTHFPAYAGELLAMIRSPKITFGGRLARDGVWRVLARSDVLAMPSLWYENAPVVIQEAFAAGLPVIASNLGAIREWVRHQEDGLLVEPGDPAAWLRTISRLAEDRMLLSHLRSNVPSPMTISEHLDRLEGLYGA